MLNWYGTPVGRNIVVTDGDNRKMHRHREKVLPATAAAAAAAI